MYRVASVLLITLLVASRALGNPPPDDLLRRGRGLLQGERVILLVRVVEAFSKATYPPEFNSSNRFANVTGKVSVLKSWKGPFSTGQLVHVGARAVCAGRAECCADYPLKAGEELLTFTTSEEPILMGPCGTWPAAESQALMAALDRAVKEDRELKDPQTDVARAPERYRIMQALKECFADGDPKRPAGSTSCQGNSLSVLVGIQRSELSAYWGPPTWCTNPSPYGPGLLPPTGADCPAEQTAVWVFGKPNASSDGLWCSSEGTGRCMALMWISVKGRTPQD